MMSKAIKKISPTGIHFLHRGEPVPKRHTKAAAHKRVAVKL
jgi:hypothetical protein